MSKIKNIINLIVVFFYKPFNRLIPQEIFRYGFIGGANLVFDVFLYYIFHNFILCKENVDLYFVVMSAPIAAFFFVFPITFTTGFLLNKYIVFSKSYLKSRTQLMRYAIAVIGSIILHYFILKFFVEFLHFWPTISKIITVIIVSIYSYCIQKFFSFKTNFN